MEQTKIKNFKIKSLNGYFIDEIFDKSDFEKKYINNVSNSITFFGFEANIFVDYINNNMDGEGENITYILPKSMSKKLLNEWKKEGKL